MKTQQALREAVDRCAVAAGNDRDTWNRRYRTAMKEEGLKLVDIKPRKGPTMQAPFAVVGLHDWRRDTYIVFTEDNT